ncbi:MAG: hypothetical protein ACJ8FC_07495 [Sphingomicrobium sp.]
MHSFHHSRGRILFEVFCAFAVVASLVGAWRQTHASALLVAAVAAGLYGMVHLFDLDRREPAEAIEPQRIDFEPEAEADLPVLKAVEVPLAVVEPQLVTDAIEEPESVEVAAPRASGARKAKTARKGSGRRTKETKVAALPLHEETETLQPEEPAHVAVAPLFEPEPYFRLQQRARFGRKAG